ncbi:MAG TPA: ComEC/Rec2 family competence protein [Anaerolineales bacterium]|nr:ComEC/Rec2 family competence protein [Anaerolineales bacterium]
MQAANPPTSLREQLATQPPLMWFSFAFLGGIVLGKLVSLSLWIWIVLVVLAIFLSILARILSPRLNLSSFLFQPLFFILFFGLFLGAARYQFSVPKFDAFHIAFYNDRDYDLLITGMIAEPPDYRDAYTNLRIKVQAVDTGDGDLPIRDDLFEESLLLARVSNNQPFEYGGRVRLRGKLKTPPENEDFSYRDYLAAQHIHSYMTSAEVTVLPGNGGNPIFRVLYSFKEKSLDNIYRLFPDPESSLLAGILLGTDTGLTRELQQAFKNTGTAHIIAISGFNISIIAGIFFAFFSRFFGERRGTVIAILGIVLYTFIVGADAAVVRAAFMGSLALWARQLGRRQMALNTLLAVAAGMCFLFNPLYLWDVGFQLSFFATLGLILYATPFSEFANRIITKYFPASTAERAAELFSEFVLLTLAAQLTTIPIMAYHFQRVSLVSFIANPFILPAQPAVMIIGGLAVLLSLVWFLPGQIVAWIAWPFVVYTIRMVELFDRVPHGTIFLGDFSIWFVILFYAALFSVTFGWSNFKEWTRSIGQKAGAVGVGSVLVILVIGLLLVWRAAVAIPDGLLHVTFLDVGSADGVLIETPSGKNILINGGESVTTLSDELGRRISSFDRKLDWLIVAATEEEQVAALPRVLERYPADAVLWSGNRQASFSAGVLNEYLNLKGVTATDAEKDQMLDLGDGATLTMLTAGPRGSVLLLEYQNFRALLPVGMSFEALDELGYGEDIGPVSILALADSGYAASNPEEWIVNLNPELVVLSVDAADPDGMPDGEVLEIVKDYALLRTDQNGWIEIATNGAQMWVNVERTMTVEPTESP